MPDWLSILKAYVDTLETAVGAIEGATTLHNKLTAARAALLDQITALRLAELDAANIPADIDTLLTRLSALRAGYLDELDFDLNARLGTPAGASLAADLLVIDNFVDDLETAVGAIEGATTLHNKLTAARAALLDQITAVRLAELDAANIPADIDTIKTQTDKLAGAAPTVGASASTNWNTGTGTSGEAGADLITIGANDTKNKVHALQIWIGNITATSSVTVKMFMQVNGTERKVYAETFIKGTDPDGLWIITGSLAIHEALRVEVYSSTNEAVVLNYDYMLEAM